jgi:hypothetical protein
LENIEEGSILPNYLERKNISSNTNNENTTEAIPFAVINAMFTLLKSVGLTLMHTSLGKSNQS